MLEKIVKNNKKITTVDSQNEITRVIFSDVYKNYFIRNDGETTAYCSDSSFSEENLNDDGVISIPQNGVAAVSGTMVSTDKDIFIKGKVSIIASNSDSLPFKSGQMTADPKLIVKEITKNGNYLARNFNCDGFSEVDVDVKPALAEKTIAENGVYTPDEGVDGFSKVNVEIPNAPKMGNITINKNNISYLSKDNGYDGYSSITVAIPNYSGNYRYYLFDDCGVPNVGSIELYKQKENLSKKAGRGMGNFIDTIVLDEDNISSATFTFNAYEKMLLDKCDKTFEGFGFSTILQDNVNSKVKISFGASEKSLIYSNVIDLKDYKTENNQLLYDVVISIDDILQNGKIGNVWNSSNKVIKIEPFDKSIIVFNRFWLNTLSTLKYKKDFWG